jgi:hypothetical protein
LKKTQGQPRTCNFTFILDDLEYKTIHGEERKNEPNFKGFEINNLEIYFIDVVEFKTSDSLFAQFQIPANNTTAQGLFMHFRINQN